ncbi:hypothetical protein SAMN05444483_11641 [Salegentibacter echinorum]|uniref:DUF4190 domain-containing protein n=1 Tax=Salegentibacter echinorum TaxID=1073325 RepID=A0A1M5KTT2_SALEC|nr:hypothetical protein [Salegentibacter echinorum]SHG56178.1 hypothetical protein SAMN05444483_11641 [Salegentibacter echinorum]
MNENRQAYEPENDNKRQTIIMQPGQNESNGTGTAGFVLALIALFLGWIPFLGWILWLLGLILSFVGLFNKPNGLAIAGLVISLIGVILLIFLFAGLAIFGSLVSFS